MPKSGPVRKKRPASRGAVPNEKALLAALVVALGAGLLGTGYGTRYVELVRDYARCSSAERAYIASTSLEEANHVLFMVDDLHLAPRKDKALSTLEHRQMAPLRGTARPRSIEGFSWCGAVPGFIPCRSRHVAYKPSFSRALKRLLTQRRKNFGCIGQ